MDRVEAIEEKMRIHLGLEPLQFRSLVSRQSLQHFLSPLGLRACRNEETRGGDNRDECLDLPDRANHGVRHKRPAATTCEGRRREDDEKH